MSCPARAAAAATSSTTRRWLWSAGNGKLRRVLFSGTCRSATTARPAWSSAWKKRAWSARPITPASAKCSRATSTEWTETDLAEIRSDKTPPFPKGPYARRNRRAGGIHGTRRHRFVRLGEEGESRRLERPGQGGCRADRGIPQRHHHDAG